MTRTVIDMGNRLIVYLLTLLSLVYIQQVGSDWFEIVKEILCIGQYQLFSFTYIYIYHWAQLLASLVSHTCTEKQSIENSRCWNKLVFTPCCCFLVLSLSLSSLSFSFLSPFSWQEFWACRDISDFIFDWRKRKEKNKQNRNKHWTFFFFPVTFTASNKMFALPGYTANTPVLNHNWLQTGA